MVISGMIVMLASSLFGIALKKLMFKNQKYRNMISLSLLVHG